MTTVAQHGLRWRMRGFPIYEHDDETGWSIPIGIVTEPQWSEADLTPAQAAEVEAIVDDERARFPDQAAKLARDKHRSAVMGLNGIRHTCVRGAPIDSRRPARGWECRLCGEWTWVKDPGDYPFVGGPADGCWLVTRGARRWTVADIPPIEVDWCKEFDVADIPVIKAVDYELCRDGRYRPVR